MVMGSGAALGGAAETMLKLLRQGSAKMPVTPLADG
jgi:hypothetical protein